VYSFVESRKSCVLWNLKFRCGASGILLPICGFNSRNTARVSDHAASVATVILSRSWPCFCRQMCSAFRRTVVTFYFFKCRAAQKAGHLNSGMLRQQASLECQKPNTKHPTTQPENPQYLSPLDAALRTRFPTLGNATRPLMVNFHDWKLKCILCIIEVCVCNWAQCHCMIKSNWLI
jgi:hypothetical protein